MTKCMSDHNDLGSFGDEQWKIDIPFFERMPSIYSQGHPSLEESTNPNGQTTSTDPAVALLHASIQRCPIDRWSQSEHDRWARPPPCTVSVDIRELWHHHSGPGAGSLPLSRHSAFTESSDDSWNDGSGDSRLIIPPDYSVILLPTQDFSMTWAQFSYN